MKENLIKLFNFFKTYVLTLIAAGGILWGAFEFVKATTASIESTKHLSVKLDSLNLQMQIFTTQQQAVVNALNDVTQQIGDINADNNKWHRSYVQFVKDNTKTSQELFRYIEGLDLAEKKN